jgi:hypothetical protein
MDFPQLLAFTRLSNNCLGFLKTDEDWFITLVGDDYLGGMMNERGFHKTVKILELKGFMG